MLILVMPCMNIWQQGNLTVNSYQLSVISYQLSGSSVGWVKRKRNPTTSVAYVQDKLVWEVWSALHICTYYF